MKTSTAALGHRLDVHGVRGLLRHHVQRGGQHVDLHRLPLFAAESLAAQYLGDLGADVVKVEAPWRDLSIRNPSRLRALRDSQHPLEGK